MKSVRWMTGCLWAIIFGLFSGSTATIAQESRANNVQSLYLPIYSHMLYGNLGRQGRTSELMLSALVSIRNTDPKLPMRILSARYYDTAGKLIVERVPKPTVLPPLGTLEIFVDRNDVRGGSGANFIVDWEGDKAINPPIVEALHANMDGGKAVSFMTHSVPTTSSWPAR